MATSTSNEDGVVSVTSKGQATIPTHLRTKYGISAPGRVRFVEEDGRLVVKPVRTAHEMMGSLRKRAPKGVDLVGELRAERKKDLAREEASRHRRG